MRVLNVGGGSKEIAIPAHFDKWDKLLLDIDQKSCADVVCDARDMFDLPKEGYDAVYCSHNLEHYYRHDLPKVMAGFKHVLSEDGFIEIHVPNMLSVVRFIQNGNDIDGVMYQSPAGPISALDMMYGHGGMIERSGNDFMAHKNGFTALSMTKILVEHGFKHVFIGESALEVIAFAFKKAPSDSTMDRLHLMHPTK
jgi:SAM-dependent methyltransferase